MAKRYVYRVIAHAPYVEPCEVEFTWNGGFSLAQKRRNITAIHEGYAVLHPGEKVLEISSKSAQENGEALSAFFLQKYVPGLGRSIPVENVFQGGKIFQNGGPYTSLYECTPLEAKRSELLKESGPLIGFRFEGRDFPLEPKTVFYDVIYLNALLENPALAKTVLEYDGFTDIEFNPQKSLNCQAKAAALFVALNRLGLRDSISDFDTFLSLLKGC